MRYSIIIPTYRRELHLRVALQSVAALEYPREEFEVVVVDDGASAASAAAVRDFEATLRIRYVPQPVRQGPAHARNIGASVADGRYLAFVDDDCEVAPDWLSRYDDAIAREHDDSLALGGRTLNAPNNTIYGISSQYLVDFLYDWYNRDSEHASFFATNNLVCERSAFLSLKGFDETFRFAAAEDRDFCDRWREMGRRLAYVPGAVVYHHQRSSLSGFLAQHAGYGRGAVDLHSTRDARGVDRPRLEPMGFYLNLIAYPVRRIGGAKLPALIALAAASQAAYAYGYFRERVRRRGAQPPRLSRSSRSVSRSA